MSDCRIQDLLIQPETVLEASLAQVRIILAIDAVLLTDLTVELNWVDAEGKIVSRTSTADAGIDIAWLPRGVYRLDWLCADLALPAGAYRVHVNVFRQQLATQVLACDQGIEVTIGAAAHPTTEARAVQASWQLASEDGQTEMSRLAWQQGDSNWFYRHFDHACRVVVDYMLGHSDLLKGQILDVGCGDGITDLGVFHRCRPERLVGVDPFKGYERLPEICRDHQIPLEQLPEGLEFIDASGNDLPFEDNSFDVVLSWGSLEHIVGGYRETLLEIKRVLKDGGLFFVHPGLYYSNIGHHLGEFSDEPFFHLTRDDQVVHDMVLSGAPDYMDRAGEFSPPEQYWQWYKELNPIRVDEFELQLKELGFEFYRASLRVAHQIEYVHPRMQNYRMQDMATDELYLSAYNRKS